MSTSTKSIGDHTTASYDGMAITIEQRVQDEPAQAVVLEPYEAIGLIHFIDDQHKLHALAMQALMRKANEAVSPEWRYDARYQCWQYFRGPAHMEIAPRALYSDRGRWAATCSGVGDLDGADGFPMYFQDLERAKLEMQAWLEHRMRDYDHTEINQHLDLLNRLRDLGDAIRRMLSHLTPDEVNALALAYDLVQTRLAPSGIDRE